VLVELTTILVELEELSDTKDVKELSVLLTVEVSELDSLLEEVEGMDEDVSEGSTKVLVLELIDSVYDGVSESLEDSPDDAVVQYE
jgi:hypothetical protein